MDGLSKSSLKYHDWYHHTHGKHPWRVLWRKPKSPHLIHLESWFLTCCFLELSQLSLETKNKLPWILSSNNLKNIIIKNTCKGVDTFRCWEGKRCFYFQCWKSCFVALVFRPETSPSFVTWNQGWACCCGCSECPSETPWDGSGMWWYSWSAW